MLSSNEKWFLLFIYLEFCLHRQILLNRIETNLKEEQKKSDSQKLKSESVLATDYKKRKLVDENDSNKSNIKHEAEDKIKLVKRRKIIEIPKEKLESVEVLKMSNLIKSFGKGDFKDFHDRCVEVMNNNSHLLELANELSIEQADVNIWHELRVGRVTASRLYETTRCTMAKGSLVDKFLGKRSGWSFAMMRGTVLEEFVFEEVKKEFPDLKRSGLIMNHKAHPFFAASPDGLHEDFVLEIKCPSTKNTFDQYIDIDKLSRKYFAQIQLQMFVTGKTKALLAVASLDFEKSREITKIWIPFDEEYMKQMIEQATEFYEKAVFPALKRKFLK